VSTNAKEPFFIHFLTREVKDVVPVKLALQCPETKQQTGPRK